MFDESVKKLDRSQLIGEWVEERARLRSGASKNPQKAMDLFLRIYTELSDQDIDDQFGTLMEKCSGNLKKTQQAHLEAQSIKLSDAIKNQKAQQEALDRIFSSFYDKKAMNLLDLYGDLYVIYEHNNNKNLSAQIPLWLWSRRLPETVEENSSAFAFIEEVKAPQKVQIDLARMPYLIMDRATDTPKNPREENERVQQRLLTFYVMQQERLAQPLSQEAFSKVAGFTVLTVLSLGLLALYKTPAAYALELKCKEQHLPEPSRLLVLSEYGGSSGWVGHSGHWDNHQKYYRSREDLGQKPDASMYGQKNAQKKSEYVSKYAEPRPVVIALPSAESGSPPSHVSHLILSTNEYKARIEAKDARKGKPDTAKQREESEEALKEKIHKDLKLDKKPKK